MSKDYNKIPAKNNMEVRNADAQNTEAQSATERPKLQGVVSVQPKKVKRSLLSRLITGVVGPEGISGIGGYVSQEIIKPAIKNILYDAITSGVSIALFGERGVPNRGSGQGSAYRPRTNYTSSYSTRPANDRAYGQQTSEPRSALVVSNVDRYGVGEYVIEDRYDAAHVLTTLTEYADRYGMVSVADYYDLIKVPSTYTDNSYGWRHDIITAAKIVPIRGGFIIKFPPVVVL